MSLVTSLERGINSATYNPEAEKAMREEKKEANDKRLQLRDALYKIRDVKAETIAAKKASSWYVKKSDALLKNGFDWLKNNPDSRSDDITTKAVSIQQEWIDIGRANPIFTIAADLAKVYKVQGEQLVKEKKIDASMKTTIDTFVTFLESFETESDSWTVDIVLSKQAELEQKANQLKSVVDVDIRNPRAAVQQAKKQEGQLRQQEKAERDTFNVGRLLSETGSIAAQVVGSLFIGMLILVSGMLTANDAIGRDPMYRIFYFIYGGIGFPVMLIYYLYRWFFGSAPRIYRLLPLYTKQADTSLGRFLFFPFTYQEDKGSTDALTKFMTDAATLVGKEYKPPAEQLQDTLSGLVEKVEKFSLNTTVKSAFQGTNSILAGLQKIELPK